MTEQEAPDFLVEASKNEEIGSCDLQRLSDMVMQLSKAEESIEEIETRLKQAKEIKTRLSQETIPEYLNQYGLSELRLADGRKVIIKDGISVTIKDKANFFNWLKSRGKEASIIKFVVSFDKMNPEKREELFDFFLEKDYDCDHEEKVHAKTQEAYFKRLFGIGKTSEEIKEGLNNGTMVLPNKVESFAKLFTFQKTKIK